MSLRDDLVDLLIPWVHDEIGKSAAEDREDAERAADAVLALLWEGRWLDEAGGVFRAALKDG